MRAQTPFQRSQAQGFVSLSTLFKYAVAVNVVVAIPCWPIWLHVACFSNRQLNDSVRRLRSEIMARYSLRDSRTVQESSLFNDIGKEGCASLTF